MKVPKGLFIVWCLALLGVVIGFGKSSDASTIQGHNVWMIIGIVSSVIFAAGWIWLFVKGNK
jgi:hypothetical protein